MHSEAMFGDKVWPVVRLICAKDFQGYRYRADVVRSRKVRLANRWNVQGVVVDRRWTTVEASRIISAETGSNYEARSRVPILGAAGCTSKTNEWTCD